MAYNLQASERTTTINYSMEDYHAEIDTAIPSVIRKLDKLAAEFPESFKCVRSDGTFKAKRYWMDDWRRRVSRAP